MDQTLSWGKGLRRSQSCEAADIAVMPLSYSTAYESILRMDSSSLDNTSLCIFLNLLGKRCSGLTRAFFHAQRFIELNRLDAPSP
jgi:hypothetical protein